MEKQIKDTGKKMSGIKEATSEKQRENKGYKIKEQ